MIEPETRWLDGFNDAIIHVMNLMCTSQEHYTLRDKIVQSLIAEYELQRSAMVPEYMHKSHRQNLITDQELRQLQIAQDTRVHTKIL